MVQVRKFSQFPPGTLTEAVGLAAGANTRGPTGGGGGGGSVTHTFPQQAPPVNQGDWLKIANPSGLYLAGQGDNAPDGEIIGICIASTATTFTVQQSGYIESGLAIPGIGPALTPGEIYFISTAAPGVMVAADATVNGEISRPVFQADGVDSGWVLPYRGAIVGGAAPSTGGGGGGTDSNIKLITQIGHNFAPGDVLRVDTAGAAIQYAKACANTFDNAQAVGIVCATPAPVIGVNFSLQECGYNIGSITNDDAGNPVVGKTIYYLSPNPSAPTLGKVTAINPSLTGQISKPIYDCEQGVANAGVNAGWVLPQRPLDLSQVTPSTHTVNQVTGFTPGQWVRCNGINTYALAHARTLADSQVAGVVVANDGTHLTIQQIGWNTGAVQVANVDGGVLTAGTLYYLSDVLGSEGKITPIVPATLGNFNRPCYVSENPATFTGQILSQKSTPVASAVGGNGLIFLGTVTVVNQATLNLDNLLSPLYDNYKVVLENFGSVTNNTVFRMRVGTGAGPVYQVVNYAGVTMIPNIGAPGAQTSGTTAFDLTLVGRTTNAAFSIAGELLIGNVNSGNPKNVTGQGIYRDNIGGTIPWGWNVSMQWQNALPITSLQFFFGAGNVATGTAKIYGYQN